MEINISDISLYTGSLHINKINKKKDVERLYFIPDEMNILGWSIDVCDYDYLNILCIQISRRTDSKICNSREDKEKFLKDLVKCINETLNS